MSVVTPHCAAHAKKKGKRKEKAYIGPFLNILRFQLPEFMQITSGKVLYQYRYRYWSLILNARSIAAYHSARRLFDHHARPCILLMHACRTLSLIALDTVP